MHLSGAPHLLKKIDHEHDLESLQPVEAEVWMPHIPHADSPLGAAVPLEPPKIKKQAA